MSLDNMGGMKIPNYTDKELRDRLSVEDMLDCLGLEPDDVEIRDEQ
ncbi:hypothetical protein [Liquorilactobacillus hordei]